jgi:hypothetical protein
MHMVSIWQTDGFAPTCEVRLHQTSYNLALAPWHLQNGTEDDDGRQEARQLAIPKSLVSLQIHKQRGIVLVEETRGVHRRAGVMGDRVLRGLSVIGAGCQEGNPTRAGVGRVVDTMAHCYAAAYCSSRAGYHRPMIGSLNAGATTHL